MNSPFEMTDFTCPVCAEVFAAWQDWSFDRPAPIRCPGCGHDLSADPSLHENGPWPLIEDDEVAEH